ncbi:MAG: LamG-like jellyroll fold domain-containing protein [Bacteroidota bacterium]
MKSFSCFLILSSLFCLSSPLSAQVNNDSLLAHLVAHWSFDSMKAGSTFLEDESLNNFHGRYYGGLKVNGPRGKALEFDGFDDYVRVPDNGMAPPSLFSSLSEGAISVWFRVDRIPKDKGIMPIFYYGAEDSCAQMFDASNQGLIIEVGHSPVHRQSERLYFTIFSNECFLPSFCYDSWTPITVGVWYHYVAVVGPNYNTGFLNGVEMTNRNYNFGWPTTHEFFSDAKKHEKLWIGRGYWDGKPQYFQGAIDEVKIFDKALALSEVQDLYNEGVFGSTGLKPALAQLPRLEVFPNPVADQVVIKWSAFRGEKASYLLYNSLGKKIQQIEVQDVETHIPVSDLPAGAYHLILQSKNRKVARGGFIKQ